MYKDMYEHESYEEEDFLCRDEWLSQNEPDYIDEEEKQ